MTMTPRKVRLAIRLAEERDVPAIQEVAREAWEATYSGLLGAAERRDLVERLYSRRSLREDIARHSSLFLVATLEGAVVGFGEIVIEGRSGEVARIGVRPDWQRRGIATSLLKRGLAALAGDGVKAVSAAVEVEDEGCRRLFEGNDFSPVAEPPTELEDYGVELVQYRRSIGNGDRLEAAASEATVWVDDGRRVCPRCHRTVREAVEACPECGATLVAEASDRPALRADRAPRFVTVLATSDESRLSFAESVLEGAGIAFATRGGGRGGRPEDGVEIRVTEARAEEARELLETLEEVQPATGE